MIFLLGNSIFYVFRNPIKFIDYFFVVITIETKDCIRLLRLLLLLG